MQQTLQQVFENLCVPLDMQRSSANINDSGSARSASLGAGAVSRRAYRAIWLFGLLPACFDPKYDHPACGPNGACPSGLTCSAQLICEDRGNAISDAGTDSPNIPPVDALACYGTDIVKICFASAPTQPLVISNVTTIDTMTSSICVATVSGGTNYCVVAGTSIMVNGTLRATGAKPLVLIASDSIIISQLIDVGSHRTTPEFIGAGADPATCTAGTPAGTRGGGAGGSFTGKGGNGGSASGGGAGGQPVNGITSITELRGGCPGQDGDGGGKGTRGHGGGAVYLIAVNRIDITGPGINAAGEGGAPGAASGGISSGAGGGGAGGVIGFDAPTLTCSSLILANGGGGGEGSGVNASGTAGADPSTTASAIGGTGGSSIGGDGGNGSSGAAGGAGASGKNGSTLSGTDGGGGGGGGGAGLIKGPAGSLGNNVSPDATP